MPTNTHAAETILVNNVYHMDCIEGMKRLAPGAIDLIITDPPFAIDFKAQRANYNRSRRRVLGGYNDVRAAEYLDFTRAWMSQAWRVLAESGSCFVFSGWNNLKDMLIAADEVGFTTVNHIIWKYQFGVVCKRRFVTSHYHCLFLCKNDKKRKFFRNARYGSDDRAPNGGSLRYQDLEDVWHIQREYWHGDKKTPTKLPAEIIAKILLYTSEANDIVLDPFLGSGQVAVVSREHKRRYIGFEIVGDYYAFARERLDTGAYRLPADP
ncbi:MAG TPA: site-specific DNA-methyltransferase [Candidatus Hydrogenedentes bacterium]|nr:site-specific DNA-methyltransferase [Candidatus Hydrogenedentota bacterium]